jgi:outer membrane receptor protein involved in Fe transport
MRIAAFFALILASAPAFAQQQAAPPTPAPGASTPLPPVTVEAAKQQQKKKAAAKKKVVQPAAASPQPAPAPATAAASAAGGGPLSVASQLRDNTSSTSTLTGTDIERSGATTAYGAVTGLPNVTPTPSGPTIPAIRGETATPTTLFSNFYQGTTSRIPLVVDSVPRISSYANSSFQNLYDVDYLQVLRGPQHTLPGTNAMAGAYIVQTNDPVFYHSAGALTEFTYNEYSGVNYREAGFVNAALSSEAALRIVAEYEKGEIPVDIQGTTAAGDKLNDFNGLNLRGKFLLKPSDIPGLSVLVSAEYGNGVDHVFNNYVDIEPFSAHKRSTSDYRILDTENWAGSVKARYQISSREEFASVTSYVNDQYSTSPRSNSAFNFTNMEENRFAQDFTYSFRNVSNLTGVVGVGATAGNRNYDVNATVGLGGPIFITAFANTDAKIQTQAAYADIAWNFAPRWDLLFGGRIEHLDDERTLVARVPVAVPPYVPFPFAQKYTYDANETFVLPKVGLRYSFQPDETVAFTVRKGYNPGGAYANLQAFQPTPFPAETYKAEEVWTYEAAYRVALMNKRLRLGATAFYNDYKDRQFAVTYQQAIRIFNEPDAESYGLEFEGKYAVSPFLDLMGNFGVLQTQIKSITPTSTASILGNDFGQDPSYSVTLGAAWRPVRNLELTAKGTYVDHYYTDFLNAPVNVAGGYTIVDLGASYDFGFAKARLFVNNATDATAYYTRNVDILSAKNAILLDPRTFGASLELKY